MDSSKFARRTLTLVTLLGLAADFLLHGASWGINFLIWVALVTTAAAHLVKQAPMHLSRSSKAMLWPTLLFAACFAWRDSNELKIANLTALGVSVGAMMVFARSGAIQEGSLARFVAWIAARWAMLLAEFPTLAGKDVDWRGHARHGGYARLTAVGRGLLLTCPLVLVFGFLFASADAVFEKDIDRAFSFDLSNVFFHLLVIGVATWVVGGLFRRLFLGDESATSETGCTPKVKLGITEVSIVLAGLDLLFLAFVVVQFKYLFGGASLVAASGDLTYAEYARSGFFELVAVAALALPLLTGLQTLLDKSHPSHERIFGALAGFLVLLLFAVIASALERMRIYVDAYGLTVLRFYTTAFMIWLGLTFAWLSLSVLQARPQRFAFGAMAAGLIVIFALNAINPDAMIAQVNLRRPATDSGTVLSLSDDALPSIGRLMGLRTSSEKSQLVGMVERRRRERSQGDWRELNLSRMWVLANQPSSGNR